MKTHFLCTTHHVTYYLFDSKCIPRPPNLKGWTYLTYLPVVVVIDIWLFNFGADPEAIRKEDKVSVWWSKLRTTDNPASRATEEEMIDKCYVRWGHWAHIVWANTTTGPQSAISLVLLSACVTCLLSSFQGNLIIVLVTATAY